MLVFVFFVTVFLPPSLVSTLGRRYSKRLLLIFLPFLFLALLFSSVAFKICTTFNIRDLSMEKIPRDYATRTGLADGCQWVYLDVGSNIGVQVRKLFEPEGYPEAEILPFFDKMFGRDRNLPSNRKHMCVFGFEPNPKHESRLFSLEQAYSRLGFRVKFFNRTAVSTEDGTASFFAESEQEGGANNYWSASLLSNVPLARNTDTYTVQTMRLATWLLDEIGDRKLPQDLPMSAPKPAVFMKLDIEGAEYTVVNDLFHTGALCTAVDSAIIEYHSQGRLSMAQPFDFDSLRWGLWLKRLLGIKCPFTLTDLDDESYLHDPNPLPGNTYV
jgi:hypothetical protein